MGENPEEGNNVEYWRNYRKSEWLNQVSEGTENRGQSRNSQTLEFLSKCNGNSFKDMEQENNLK